MKKSSILLIIPASLALISCGRNKNNSSNSNQNHQTNIIEDEDVGDLKQHAVSISADPNASFYLKVGEKRTVSVSLSPSPTDSEEKKFTWSTKSSCLKVTQDSSSQNKAVIEGLSQGTGSVLAQNTYNETLKKYFNVNVINFDEENNYLWQYTTTDRAQFGYNSKENKQGVAEGTAVLNGKEWQFTRSKTTSLQSSGGAVGFGKGSDPEEVVTLKTSNDRLIKRIVIETSSAKSLARLTAKVGSTTILDQKVVPDKEYDQVATIDTGEIGGVSGEISLKWETPAFDITQAGDPYYKAPGAVYLKSILLYYSPEEAESIEIDTASKHQVDYEIDDILNEDGLIINKVSARGVRIPLNIEKEVAAKRLAFVYPETSEASHEAKSVTVLFRPNGEGTEPVLSTSYSIHVRDPQWPTTLSVEGSLGTQALIAGDYIDYSNLKIKVTFDEATNDCIYFPFSNDGGIFEITCYDAKFQDYDPFIAEKAMESGFRVGIQGLDKKSSWSTVYTVDCSGLTIQDAIYDRIELRKMVDELGITTTAKAVSYTSKSGRVTLNFDSLKKGDYFFNNSIKLPTTNKEFSIVINDKKLCMDRLNVEFANTSKSINEYTLSESFVGGLVYGEALIQLENNKVVYNAFDLETNAVKLSPGLTSTGSVQNTNNGINSILVRYAERAQVDYQISIGETAPVQKVYDEGDVFNPTGVTVMLTSDYQETSINVTELMTWYDGATYATKPQLTLTPESTGVVGVFNDHTVNVAIEKVNVKVVSLTLVKSIDELATGDKLFIVSRSAKAISLGSAKGSYTSGKGAAILDGVSFLDTAELNILYQNDYYEITKNDDGTFIFRTVTGNTWGLTDGGSVSNSSACAYQNFTIAINDETSLATIEIKATTTKGEKDMILGFSGTLFNLYEASKDKNNISLYKVN